MCPHRQQVGGIASVSSKSRERFLVAEQWGKAKVRRDWPGVRCRCPAGPAPAVVPSLLTAQRVPHRGPFCLVGAVTRVLGGCGMAAGVLAVVSQAVPV